MFPQVTIRFTTNYHIIVDVWREAGDLEVHSFTSREEAFSFIDNLFRVSGLNTPDE